MSHLVFSSAKAGDAFLLVNLVQMDTLLIILLFSVGGFAGAVADCPDKASLSIHTSKIITAQTGSCVRIPCRYVFKNPAVSSTGNIYGVWIKNDSRFEMNPSNVVFNSSKTLNSYPMSVMGDLSKKNCTTLFSNLSREYSNTYFFRVEMGSFKGTASCDALQIAVQDSPPRPTFEVPGDLKENESVRITCSAPTPCPQLPPRLTWSLQQDAPSHSQENTDGTWTTKIQQTVTLSDQHDGLKLRCSAAYPVAGGRPERTAVAEFPLSVSYAPKDTSASISPSGLGPAGLWVNLSCSSRAKPAISSFTWFQVGVGGAAPVSQGEVHSVGVTEGGAYYCVAANDLGHQASAHILLPADVGRQQTFWAPIVGAILGVVIFICVLLFLRWLTTSHSTPHQTQGLALRESVRTADSEEIHYGEIDFSKLRPEPSSGSQQPEVVYAQIQMQ